MPTKDTGCGNSTISMVHPNLSDLSDKDKDKDRNSGDDGSATTMVGSIGVGT